MGPSKQSPLAKPPVLGKRKRETPTKQQQQQHENGSAGYFEPWTPPAATNTADAYLERSGGIGQPARPAGRSGVPKHVIVVVRDIPEHPQFDSAVEEWALGHLNPSRPGSVGPSDELLAARERACEVALKLKQAAELRRTKQDWVDLVIKRQIEDEPEKTYLARHGTQLEKELQRILDLWAQGEKTPASKQLSATLLKYGVLDEFRWLSEQGPTPALPESNRFRDVLWSILLETGRHRLSRAQSQVGFAAAGKGVATHEKDIAISRARPKTLVLPPGDRFGLVRFFAELDRFPFMRE